MANFNERRARLRDGVSTSVKALSIDEAAAVCGISKSGLYAKIAANAGPRLTKIGARTLVLSDDLNAWIFGMREATAPLKPAVPPRGRV
jgi:predicted DNA-binding transcriptional regulator AlpA